MIFLLKMFEAKFYTTLPDKSGVYLFYNSTHALLYIGKAINLKKRVSSYFSKKISDEKTQNLVSNIVYIDYRITKSQYEALLLEQNLISTLKPKYNIQLKDDKSYTLIGFTKEIFPSVLVIRQRDKFNGITFGPFISKMMTIKLYEFIQKTFKIRSCKKKLTSKSKPCLNYHIGKCSAPCAGFIEEKMYNIQYKRAISFLRGEYSYLLKEIEEKINFFSSSLEYEKANTLKNQYQLIKEFHNSFSYKWSSEGIYDFIAFYLRNNNGYITLLRIKDGIKTMSLNKKFSYIGLKEDFDSLILQAIISLYSEIEPANIIYLPSSQFSSPLLELLKKDIIIKTYRSKQELAFYRTLLLQLIELYKQSFKIALCSEDKKLK